MTSARHHVTDSPTTAATSRRALLRGGLALGAAVTTAAATAHTAVGAPGALPGPADYPPIEFIPAHSSNYSSAGRPSDNPIAFVVIHVTQGGYAGTISHFQNAGANSSAHYVLRSRDGHLAQMVREKDIAWHAGNWDYNTRSIGIEHEGFIDDPKWFTEAMYRSSAKLTAAICDKYAIPRERSRIIGHHEVPGATHTDPGKHWNWDLYMRLVAEA
ncbi:N-acetylmuramoyl-L-alanine amidase [Streptomyces sp. ODS28]|uniref:N-acetylmuramoyl-L-alanine amidase n=1 Tax=Streptomyces sp. ODS28 TaxID=3136688 RepID=UPI0031E9CB76